MKKFASMFSTKNMWICTAYLFIGLVGSTNAGVISVASGYEVSYDISLHSLPTNGGDIQDTFIFEWNDNGDFSRDYGYTIAGRDSTRISHKIDFEPTAAFLIGYAKGIPGIGDEKDHLFTFVNSRFANDVTGVKWSEVFTGVPPEPRIGHSAMVSLLVDGAGGDQSAIQKLTDFVKSEAYRAAFDPAGRFSALEWTGATPDVPVSAPLALLGAGLAGFGWSSRRSHRRTH